MNDYLEYVEVYFKYNPGAVFNLLVVALVNILFNVLVQAFSYFHTQYKRKRKKLIDHDIFEDYKTIANDIKGLRYSLKTKPVRAVHIQEWQLKANELIIEFCYLIVSKKIQKKSNTKFNALLVKELNSRLDAFEIYVKDIFKDEKAIVLDKFGGYAFPQQERIKLDVVMWAEIEHLSNYEKTVYILNDMRKYFMLLNKIIYSMAGLNGELDEYEKTVNL